MQKLRFVIKNVSELPEIPDTVVVSLNDLDNYAFSRLTLKAIEFLAQSERLSKWSTYTKGILRIYKKQCGHFCPHLIY